MSVTIIAYTVLGILIDKSDIDIKEEIVKAFNHNKPEDQKFDQDSGKRLWKVEQTPDIEIDDQTIIDNLNNKEIDLEKLGLGLVHDYEAERYYIGMVLELNLHYDSDKPSFSKDVPTEKIKEKLKKLFEPYDLWYEEQFGLHAILHFS
jgi:hypothetical protein